MAEKAVKLSTYIWECNDRKGNKTMGEVSSDNIVVAKAQLRKQGIVPTRVKKKPVPLFGSRKKKITPFDIAVFTRQLATMMQAGVPLVQSFDIVADGVDNQSLRELVLDIKNEVAAGNSFAAALRRHPRHFDDLFCNLVDSGERSGALETMLNRVANYLEKSETLKKKVKKAMTYPVAVLIIAVIVTGILLIKVVPQFKELFAGFGADLPAFTMFVIGISEWLQAWWYLVLAGIIGTIFAFREARFRSEPFANLVDRTVLKIPVMVDILEKSAIARFARVLSTTFAAGVPLVDAFDSVAGATGNVVFREAVLKTRDEVSTGVQLQFSMKTTGVFPTMAVQLVAIGEESGALDSMLEKVADHFEEEVDNAVDNLTTLMEPMIMAVLGVLVGGLIIAMYLPIFQMGNVV